MGAALPPLAIEVGADPAAVVSAAGSDDGADTDVDAGSGSGDGRRSRHSKSTPTPMPTQSWRAAPAPYTRATPRATT